MRFSILLFVFVVFSCGVKQTRYAINSGDYNEAIEIATNSLRNNKDRKGKQEYIYMLEEAFEKATERDLNDIELLKKSNSPRNYEQIYNLYVALDQRQQSIKPLLPLKLLDSNRDAKFKFENYNNELLASRANFVKHLYDNSTALLLTKDKMSYRRAYDYLVQLTKLEPDYKNTNQLVQQAFSKGADYVIIRTINNTGLVIPLQLQTDLLNFSTSGLDEKWVVYHADKQSNTTYDFAVDINFRQINFSPDLVREREFTVEKEVLEKRQKRDRRGQVINDSSGNPVMEEVTKVLSVTILETTQSKSVEIVAKIDYQNLNTKQLLQSFPLRSEFVFQNIFARYNGDINAVDADYKRLFNSRAMPFPANEQMVFDTGEDLKAKVRNILRTNKVVR